MFIGGYVKKNKQGNLFKIESKTTLAAVDATYVVADNLSEALDKFFNFGKKEGWLKIVDIPECISQITALGTVILEAENVSRPKDT